MSAACVAVEVAALEGADHTDHHRRVLGWRRAAAPEGAAAAGW